MFFPLTDEWLKLDDDMVTMVTTEEIIKLSGGGVCLCLCVSVSVTCVSVVYVSTCMCIKLNIFVQCPVIHRGAYYDISMYMYVQGTGTRHIFCCTLHGGWRNSKQTNHNRKWRLNKAARWNSNDIHDVSLLLLIIIRLNVLC